MKNINLLIGDTNERILMKSGSPEKYDYQYKRNGVANIFVAVDFKGGKKDITVTDQRIKSNFAHYIKHLVNNVFPNVKMLKIVMDNLNTHIYTAILKNFEFKEALELINKVNFYYNQNMPVSLILQKLKLM
jgi:hypothetical protein